MDCALLLANRTAAGHLIGNRHGIDNRPAVNSDVGYSLEYLGPWPLPEVR